MFRKKLVSLLTAALMIAGTSGSLWEELYVPVSAQAVTEIQEQDDHRELIELCRSYYGYNDLGKRTNGAALQSFYDALYEAFSGVWTGETDYEAYPNDSDYYVVARINYREYGITDSEAKACYYALRHDNPVMYYLANQWATGGQFYYAPQGIETPHPASAPQKVLIDGQIYILRGDIVYTIDGREVK